MERSVQNLARPYLWPGLVKAGISGWNAARDRYEKKLELDCGGL